MVTSSRKQKDHEDTLLPVRSCNIPVIIQLCLCCNNVHEDGWHESTSSQCTKNEVKIIHDTGADVSLWWHNLDPESVQRWSRLARLLSTLRYCASTGERSGPSIYHSGLEWKRPRLVCISLDQSQLSWAVLSPGCSNAPLAKLLLSSSWRGGKCRLKQPANRRLIPNFYFLWLRLEL